MLSARYDASLTERDMTTSPKARITAAALALGMAATPVATLAQDFNSEIRARQGQMRVQALNLGVLGGMARGQMEYDAAMAQAAADNLAAVAMLDQRFAWPEGSSLMDVDNTRAMPDIWDDFDAFAAEWVAYVEAAQGLQAVAGDGLEALGPGLQALGQTCGSCHEDFQQEN